MNRNPEARRALGRIFRAWREEIGLSQEQLAIRAGVDRTWVGAIERGESNLSFEGIVQFLSALGRTWTELGRALDGEPALRRGPRPRGRLATGAAGHRSGRGR